MTTKKKQLISKNTRSKRGGVITKSGKDTNKRKAIKATRKIKETCGICLEDVNKSDNIPTLPCKHQFHKNCLIEWCKSKHNTAVKCPLCRIDIVDVCKDINPQPDYADIGPRTPPLLTMADLEPDAPPLTMADLDGPMPRSFNNYDEEDEILRNGNVGDLVNYEPNNQQGVVYYKISLLNGEKYLEPIGNYDGYYNDMMGGKKKSNRVNRKSKKNRKKQRNTRNTRRH